MIRHALTAAIAVAFIGAPAVAMAQSGSITPTNGEPALLVGLFNRRPDATVSGFTSINGSRVGQDLSGTLSLAPCNSLSASSYDRIPAPATDAWRLRGHVTEFSDTSVSFELTWQRVRENGKDVQGAPQSRMFTLPASGRETLDSISAPVLGTCPEHSVTLDVAFDRLPVAVRLPGGGVTSVKVGAEARGGGGVVNAVGASAAGIGGGTSPVGSGAVARPNTAGRPVYPTVDLWLVHQAAGQAEQSERQRTEVTPFARATTFAPFRIVTSAGVITVTVECYVEDGRTQAGEPRLFVSASRKVTFSPSGGQARDVRPVVEGSIRTAVEKPGPDDVLAFELPGIQYPGAPPVSDKFSIRLRLVP